MRLEERFKTFLSTDLGAESVDDLSGTMAWPAGKQKADFLFENRRIVCELKRLTADPLPKLDKMVGRLTQRADWPLIFGSRSLSNVLRRLPDGDQVNAEASHLVSNVVEDAIRDANGQIRDTKEVLELPDADGLLVILNEDVHLHSPQLVVYRVHKALEKVMDRHKRGPRFPWVSAVLLIDVAHVSVEDNNSFAFPIIACQNMLSPGLHIVPFVDQLMYKWAEFEGLSGTRTDWGGLNHTFRNATEIRD